MSDLYERIDKLCKDRRVNITTMCKESGASRGSLTDLKSGRKQNLSIETLTKIAVYFNVSVDYLTGRTDDPIDYDNGDLLADIPPSFLKAFDGDAQKAYSAKLAVEEDNKTLPPTKEQQGRNVIKIAGRNGVYRERILSDSQLAALESILDQLPDASDDL